MIQIHNFWLKTTIVLVLTFALYSCKKDIKTEQIWRHIEISPKDESQTITIITIDNKRYFMDGKHKTIPNDNYLLVDISDMDQLADEVAVCWNDSVYKWKVYSLYAKMLENKLDTTKYYYYESLGKYGQPTLKGYLEYNCGNFMIREDLIIRGDVKIKYIHDINL